MTNLVKTIFPYIKRMPKEKIHVHIPNEETENALRELDKDDRLIFNIDDNGKYDVVITDGNNLSKDYSYINPSGIFVGDNHNDIPVKEALGKFRREEKIGIPIHVANGIWFWYKR
jgi:hypothetical protein